MKGLRHPLRVAFVASALGSAACGALLGIEDVHEQEGPAPGMNGGGSGEGGDSSSSGGIAPGEAGASASGSPSGGEAHGGSASGGGSSAGSSMGGSGHPNGGSGGGGSGAGGASGGGISTGGAGAGGATQIGSTVTGRVIDFRGHKLSGVAVEIAGKQVTTDSSGAFTVSDVPAVYDASLIVHFLNVVTQTHAYFYQGLKRRNPTLQVYQGLSEQSQTADVTFTGTDQSATGTRTISLSLAGPDGAFELRDAPKPTLSRLVKWLGPSNTQEQAHALVWQNNATSGLPEGYYAYATSPIMLSSATTAHVALGLSLLPSTIASSPITGTVTPAGFSDRTDSVSVRFSSGATMRLVSTTPTSSTFSYLVPALPGTDATITFAASEGCSPSSTGCGIVHKSGLSGGGAPLSVQIPSPATNLTLAPATAVDQNTVFSWMPAAGNGGPSVSMLINGTSGNDRLYVISNEHSFKLPSVVNGMYSLVHGESYRWQIETHGNPASVDDMTDSLGFIDAFSTNHSDFSPLGQRTGDGAYTLSGAKFFTVAN